MRLTPRAGFGPVPELTLGAGLFLSYPPYIKRLLFVKRKRGGGKRYRGSDKLIEGSVAGATT
jgi:hypothetical protein